MEKNLVPFDLERAEAGAKVVTRCGFKVEILCTDLTEYGKPIGAKVYEDDGKVIFCDYNKDGIYLMSGGECALDLMIDDTEEEWMVVYELTDDFYDCIHTTFPSREKAQERCDAMGKNIKSRPIRIR